jgi:hypothetical protein
MMIASKNPFFQIEIAKNKSGVTSFAGLALVREALEAFELKEQMKNISIKTAGYRDVLVLEALILLLAAGGRSLSDWEYLKADAGFLRMFGASPSVDTLERYLKILPLENIPYQGDQAQRGYCPDLEALVETLIKKAYLIAGCPKKLSLDLDASLFAAEKSQALFCYDKFKAYQPLMAYCPELGLVLAHEFRDGNISPALGYKRLYEKCRKLLPLVKWKVRADSAGYQLNFLDTIIANGDSFYITVDQWKTLKKEAEHIKHWQPYIRADGIKTQQEIAELSYVPSFSSQEQLKFRRDHFRYLAIRKLKDEPGLFEEKYIYQIIVSNDTQENLSKIFQTHWKRCGSVEYAFSQLKSGCGMAKMPSGCFSANAAWFSLGVLTHNLLRMIQRHLLPKHFKKIEIQTLRFRFLRTSAWVISHARSTLIRFARGSPVYEIYLKARQRLQKCFPQSPLA